MERRREQLLQFVQAGIGYREMGNGKMELLPPTHYQQGGRGPKGGDVSTLGDSRIL